MSDKLRFVAEAAGRETKRQAEAYRTVATMADMARDVAALMDQLRIDRATICGLSMGCYVAFEFIHLFPSRVRALVLCGPRAQGPDDAEKKSREQPAQRVLIDEAGHLMNMEQPEIVNEVMLEFFEELV